MVAVPSASNQTSGGILNQLQPSHVHIATNRHSITAPAVFTAAYFDLLLSRYYRESYYRCRHCRGFVKFSLRNIIATAPVQDSVYSAIVNTLLIYHQKLLLILKVT